MGQPIIPTEASREKGEGLQTGDKYTTAALWVIADFDAKLLGSSWNHATAHPAQHSAMVNSYRFMNSDIYFNDMGLTVLLRLLESNPIEDREKWWLDIRACRRRRQIQTDTTIPVHTIFTTHTEYQFMEYRAVVDRVQWSLKDKGMLVFDAFRAFNSSNSGLMTCSELYGGLEFLGIPFKPEQVYDLVRKLAQKNEGLVSYVDFKRVFKRDVDDMESHIAEGGGSMIPEIVPKNIPELYLAAIPKEKEEKEVILTSAILKNFKVKLNPVGTFEPVCKAPPPNLNPNCPLLRYTSTFMTFSDVQYSFSSPFFTHLVYDTHGFVILSVVTFSNTHSLNHNLYHIHSMMTIGMDFIEYQFQSTSIDMVPYFGHGSIA